MFLFVLLRHFVIEHINRLDNSHKNHLEINDKHVHIFDHIKV